MRKLLLPFFVVLFALTAMAQNLTVEQVVAKNLEARGGMEKIKAVKSMRMSGTINVGQGIQAPLTMEFKRPNKMRMEIVIQGLSLVQAYDGNTGWAISPFGGNKDPQPMSEDELKIAQEQADMDGALVDYAEKGNKLELLGKEPVEGADAYKLKVTLKNGDVRYYYLDADALLEIKTESKFNIRGTERESETSIGDYKDVEGLMIPFAIESGIKDAPQKQKITVEKVEINPEIEDARFVMPPPAPPAEKKPGE